MRTLDVMSGRRRLSLILAVVLVGVPAFLVAGYLLWRPTPPEGGPRIGVSMTSSLVRVVRQPVYEDALARAGGRVVPITVPGGSSVPESAISAVLDEIDALLLGGGEDVDPALYSGDPDKAAFTDRMRDEFEIQLIHGALDRNMPILGICRGIQILNVAHGGTIRDLRDNAALSERHGIDMVNSWTAHDINIASNTHLAGVVGAGVHQVNSWHGQAVGRIGTGLRVCATADDGVIEAIERPDCTFVIGIQWHPEFTLSDDASYAIFRMLVQQAEMYRIANRVNPAAPNATE